MLVLLFACRSDLTLGGASAVDDENGESSTEDGDEEAIPGTGVDDGSNDDDPAEGSDEALWGCSEIFEQDRLPTYNLTISDEEWRAISVEFQTRDGTKGYHPVEAFEMDGETLENVSIRLKGNEGYSWVGTKMQFVLSFVEVDPDQRFHGQRHVAFDATWYDPSLLNNRAATRFMRRIGQPAPCTNHGLLYINEAFYGVYAHMEQLDHEYLERNFGKEFADGNLYKYGYELVNNEGADTRRIQDWWSNYDFDHLASFGDPAQWVSEWAAEATMPDWDGYWSWGHNYYIYDHPEQGFMFLAWDMDATFYYGGWPEVDPIANISWGSVPHEQSVLSEEEYLELFIDDIALYRDAYDPAAMEAEVLEWEAQIVDWVAADPNKYYTTNAHVDAVELLRQCFYDRTAFLDAWLVTNNR